MADKTKIEWADATLNYMNGCSLASPGCINCYAMKQAHRFDVRRGLTEHTKGGMVWTGEVRANHKALLDAMRWRRGRRIFWNAHGDLFHQAVPLRWIDEQYAACALSPQHEHLILTKRSDRMRVYCNDPATPGRIARVILDWLIAGDIKHVEPWPVQSIGDVDHPDDLTIEWPLPNVWQGVSVEDQKRADERIPDLIATPAAVRFISAEPLLGPVDLGQLQDDLPVNAWLTWLDAIDWVIVGGESGPKARPMHPDWARLLRDQCGATGTAFLFKQWGEWAPGENASGPPTRTQTGATWFDERWSLEDFSPSFELHCDDEPDVWRLGKKHAGRMLDGVEHNGFPEVAHG